MTKINDVKAIADENQSKLDEITTLVDSIQEDIEEVELKVEKNSNATLANTLEISNVKTELANGSSATEIDNLQTAETQLEA